MARARAVEVKEGTPTGPCPEHPWACYCEHRPLSWARIGWAAVCDDHPDWQPVAGTRREAREQRDNHNRVEHQPQPFCSVDGCGRREHARGPCSTHYHRVLRGHSDPLGAVTFTPGRPIGERLLAQREVTPEGCWRWTGSHNPKGYGQMRVGKRKVDTHRLAYEAWIGPIPDGLEVDHVADRGCVHRDCFNPAHLEAVTHAENLRRARKARRAS